VKTVSRVYDSYGQAREAVRALEAAGVPSSEVSLIANKHVSAAHADVNEISEAPVSAALSAAVPDCWPVSACWRFPDWAGGGSWLARVDSGGGRRRRGGRRHCRRAC
jgi:hypothetical protein